MCVLYEKAMNKKPKNLEEKKQASSRQLYHCEHCNKRLTFKTFSRHRKLFLKVPVAGQTVTTVQAQLPLLLTESVLEQGIAIAIFLLQLASYYYYNECEHELCIYTTTDKLENTCGHVEFEDMEVGATHTGTIQDDSCVNLEDTQPNKNYESSGESSSLSGNTVCLHLRMLTACNLQCYCTHE